MAQPLAAPDLSAGSLARVVCEAAGLLPSYAAAVDRCRHEYDPGQALAREVGALTDRFERLRLVVAELVADDPLATRVEQILCMHVRLLCEASALAFRPRGPRWSRLVASFGDGLTGASDDLLRLAAGFQRSAVG
jgi:hypothetical protein